MAKFVSSVIVVIAISGPYLKSRYPMLARRFEAKKALKKGGNANA